MKAVFNPLLARMLAIVVLGMAAGLAANQWSPRGLPLVAAPKRAPAAGEYLSIERAQQFWHSGAALFLDAREPADYAASHIGNALNLPAQSFQQRFGDLATMLSPEAPLVLYCDGTECELSHRLRDSLRQLGYTNTHLLFNGMTAWRQAGLPITAGGGK